MNLRKTAVNFFLNISKFLILLIAMAGFVPKNATKSRIVIMTFSVLFALYLTLYQPYNSDLAAFYFIISEISYLGYITIVLSKKGLRHWFMRKWNAKGYVVYETILGCLFFHNAASIGYIASSTPGSLFSFIQRDLLSVILFIMFFSGFIIKILAAKAVTIDIYYWKDMFLGKKITDFVETGPYRYFKNPMYGIGQVQAYATAIWYGSEYGLVAAFVNQVLIFTFYYLVEKKFIDRTYKKAVC
jgi:protein-S-isoprenylcysteine O-methyltransferase Ste14